MRNVKRTPTSTIAATAALLALAACSAHAEPFIDIGIGSARVDAKVANQDESSNTDSSVHIGIGAERRLQGRSSIGVRLELDDVDSSLLLAVRALDYKFHVSDRFAVTAFLGAARLDLATPAYGYYLGGGVQLRQFLPAWDLGIDVRLGDKIARDNILPSDPQGGSPDNFYDLLGISLYLSRRF